MVDPIILSMAERAGLLAKTLFVAYQLCEHLLVEGNPEILLHFDHLLQATEVLENRGVVL